MVEEAEESREEKVTMKQEQDDTPQPDSERSGIMMSMHGDAIMIILFTSLGMVEEAEESREEKVTVKQEEDDTSQPDSEHSGIMMLMVTQ